LKEAEAIARQAVAINRDDPWAHHAIAHVMETQRRTEEGIAWMEQHSDTWERCNSMLYTHNWWHLALFYLTKNLQSVLPLYDQHVWGYANRSSPKDQVGAIALLLRLELRGVNVGDRWSEISRYLFPRIHEHALPFQDLHYIYALARAEHFEQAAEMLRSMQAHTHTIRPDLQQAWREVAVPAAHGMIAHAKADWSTAIAQLKQIL
ncbi:MAG: tetratricopeptide repeat protein, partial [Microcoleus sp. SIO2G3]|nr:tetratricopeptide repeat protein [Microcoleus sp. SIO2G3]